MKAHEMPFFKIVSPLIDSGIWARMSAAARTLYPVLLRFSDGSFKPVYPGSRVLLKLTGFKQKSSIRKARNELIELGLVSVTTGSGRKNTCYHFRFDTLGDMLAPPRVSAESSAEGSAAIPGGVAPAFSGDPESTPQYNKIHISINNNVQSEEEGGAQSQEAKEQSTAAADRERIEFFERRFGREMVDLAISECELAGMPATADNVSRVLYQNSPKGEASIEELLQALRSRISPGSLQLIEEQFLETRAELLIFSSALPGHLQALLRRMSDQILFEQSTARTRKDFWAGAGGDF